MTWDTIASHQKDIFRELLESQNFSDVTLVSDDQYQFKAHKFVLSSSSSVFQRLLDNNPEKAIIYLWGIHQEEIKSILQFMYKGEVTIYQDRINEFLKVSKDLGIKEIGDKKEGSDDNKLCDEIKVNIEQFLLNENQSVDPKELQERSCQILTTDNMFSCNYCDMKLSTKKWVDFHIKSNHNNAKYRCQQCDYQATQENNLKHHVKYK